MGIADIATGGRSAFEALFRTHYRPLCAFANGYLKDAERAEDLVQDLFFHLWENRDTLGISGSVKSYLFTATRNRCLNALQASARRRTVAADEMQLPDEAVDDEDLHTERIARVQAAVAALPEERRRIFRMSKFEGLKYQQIADQLGISVKTVENQMGKALASLRSELGDLLPLLAWLAWLLEGADRGLGA